MSGCGGDDDGGDEGGEATTHRADLTPEAVAENLEAAGYDDVLVGDPDEDCQGLEGEVSASDGNRYVDVYFFATDEEAVAAEECVIEGVTEYCSQAAAPLVYSADCYNFDDAEKAAIMTDLMTAAEGGES